VHSCPTVLNSLKYEYIHTDVRDILVIPTYSKRIFIDRWKTKLQQ
jgi:hypothetical protein